MTTYIDFKEVTKKIDLQGGLSVVLLDRLAKELIYGSIECARNIFLVDITGKISWQVETDFDADGGPFTNIFCDGQEVKGYRWDGCVYEINLGAGRATPVSLLK